MSDVNYNSDSIISAVQYIAGVYIMDKNIDTFKMSLTNLYKSITLPLTQDQTDRILDTVDTAFMAVRPSDSDINAIYSFIQDPIDNELTSEE